MFVYSSGIEWAIRHPYVLACAVHLPAGRGKMKPHQLYLTAIALAAFGIAAGCSTATQSADVSESVRTSLNQAGYKDVTSTQDRDKGVVTLGGHVSTDADKTQAQS